MNKKKVTSADIIDFLEFDAIRATVINFVAIRKKKKFSTKFKTPYTGSYFYVGRGVSRVVLKNVFGVKSASKTIAIYLAKRFPEYSVYFSSKNVYVYLRGEPRSR